jgi:hypothetical protein
MDFNYLTGEITTSRVTRVYRSQCGNVGKVIRTPVHNYHAGTYGKPRVAFFIWHKPDSAPEYKTIEDCLQALETHNSF